MDRQRPTEEELKLFTDWILDISETGRVTEIDPMLLRSVLSEYGANFEPRPELDVLALYSNLKKRPGLDAVWGEENVDEYKRWVKGYILEYEAETGRPLPVLEGTEIKTSGMMQFFGELTSYAAQKLSFEKYKELTEDRFRKGLLWKQRDLNEPIVPSPHSSFPPKFPSDAWEFIKTFKEE